MGLEELMSLEISGGVTGLNWERRKCGGGVGRSGGMERGGSKVGAGVDPGRSDTGDRDL